MQTSSTPLGEWCPALHFKLQEKLQCSPTGGFGYSISLQFIKKLWNRKGKEHYTNLQSLKTKELEHYESRKAITLHTLTH